MTVPGRAVTSTDDLPAPWDADPFVTADFHEWAAPVVWGGPDALLVAVRVGEGRHAFVGTGVPGELARVLDDVVAAGIPRPDGPSVLDDGGLVSASLTRGAWDRCAVVVRERLALPRAVHWDWLWTTDPPPAVDGEDRVEELDPVAGAEEIRALHAVALPRTFFPVDRDGARWFGRRDDDGRLRAVGGGAGWDQAVHLGGIATDPAWRGRGFGGAVTAALTRAGLAATGRVGLGLYADNAVAYRTYRRLGFRLGQPVETRLRASSSK